jgi:hypothetical protein
MPGDSTKTIGGPTMRLKCVCGTECYPVDIEELKMYQLLPCSKTKTGRHIFKIPIMEGNK